MLLLSIAAVALLVGALALTVFDAPLWAAVLLVPGVFLGLALLGFLFVLYLCKRVDQSVPQEEDDKLYRTVTDLILESALPFLRIRVKQSGMEKVPETGRFLLVCNHCNDSDPIILLRCFRAFQLAFISKRENSSMFVIGPMMHKIQCQLINRENDREALKTIIKCIQMIKEDKVSVCVFPEGGIIEKDKLSHFRSGAGNVHHNSIFLIALLFGGNSESLVFCKPGQILNRNFIVNQNRQSVAGM